MKILEPYQKQITPKQFIIVGCATLPFEIFQKMALLLQIDSIFDVRVARVIDDSMKLFIKLMQISYTSCSISALELAFLKLKKQKTTAIFIDSVKNYPQQLIPELRNLKIAAGDSIFQEMITDSKNYSLKLIHIKRELTLIQTQK